MRTHLAGLLLAALCLSATPPHAAESEGKPNRLASESSLYLLMHARNPVDWYPWGEEALTKAKQENKLIFLSVGYSSCHFCHVMEREAFSDEKIAKLLNEHFVSIKVDREERPDVDSIYMTALMEMNGRGGWPLSMFLTPDAKPVMGGTYFPPYTDKDAEEERTGFYELADALRQKWRDDPQEIRQQGDRVTDHLQQLLRQRPVILGTLDDDKLDHLLVALSEDYDAQHGGFGYSDEQPNQSKFPQPSKLLFLVDHARRNPKSSRAEKMLVGTLAHMAAGGIRDHVGGGFHRYSTDRFWRIPHFEKMLYDNGQLATVYAEAFALTGRADFRRTAEEICDFVLREMTDEAGGFHAAIDAESEQQEGKFYAWTARELETVLTDEERITFHSAYGIMQHPGIEEHHVILMHRPLPETAKELGVPEEDLAAGLQPLKQKLLAARAKRPRPVTDKKILAAWNGLMIRGLADTGRIVKNEKYVQAAGRAAGFVLSKLIDEKGRLHRSYTDGGARLNAYLDDYAFLVDGLIALHRATGEEKWLAAAEKLTEKQIELFGDDRVGGFFFTSHDHPALIARSKDPTDGDLPAGNSVAADNLLYLAAALDKPAYAKQAERTLRSAIPLFDRAPQLVPRMAVALARHLQAR